MRKHHRELIAAIEKGDVASAGRIADEYLRLGAELAAPHGRPPRAAAAAAARVDDMPTLTRKEVEEIALLARAAPRAEESSSAMQQRARRDPRALRALAAVDTDRCPADDARGAARSAAARRRCRAVAAGRGCAARRAGARTATCFVVPAIIPGTGMTEWLCRSPTPRSVIARGELTAVDASSIAYLERIRDARSRARRVPRGRRRRRARRRPPRSIARARAGEPLGAARRRADRAQGLLVTKGLATTAGSKILEGWIPPYDGTVVEKLRAAGAVILGKVNCDEFAMGIVDRELARTSRRRTRGTRRACPAAARAAARPRSRPACARRASAPTPAARSASRRRSAASSGIKPTYGRVSRWGVVAFASSLDQVGPLTRTVARRGARARGDRRLRSARLDLARRSRCRSYADALAGDVNGLRIGLPHEYFGDGDRRRRPRRARQAPSRRCASAARSSSTSRCRTPSSRCRRTTSSRRPRRRRTSRATTASASASARRGTQRPARPLHASRAAPASAPRSSAGSCSARTRCAPATTTRTTRRRSRSAR